MAIFELASYHKVVCCSFSSSNIRTFEGHRTFAKYLAPVYGRLGNRRVCRPHSRAVRAGFLFNVPDLYKSPVPKSTSILSCMNAESFDNLSDKKGRNTYS